MDSPFHILSSENGRPATFLSGSSSSPEPPGSSSSPGMPGAGSPEPSVEVHPRPDWLKVRFFGGDNYQELKRIMRTLDLHTVCESARCPNQGECWDHRTATFMILGDICTRACGFCAVTSGRPASAPDEAEPERVAQAVEQMRSAVCGGDVGKSRRSSRWRVRHFCADHRRDPAAGPGLQGRSADSGFSRRLAGARNRDGGGPGRAESQYGDRAAALPSSAAGRDFRAFARIAAARKAAGSRKAGENGHDAGPRRNPRGSAATPWRNWPRREPTFLR